MCGLRFRSTAVLAGLVLTATGVSAAMFVQMSARLVKDQASTGLIEVAHTLASAASESIERGDRAALLKIAEELIPRHNVSYVAFADRGGRVLAGAQHGEGQLSQILYDDGLSIPIDQLDRPLLLKDRDQRPRLDVTCPVYVSSSSPADALSRPAAGFVRIGQSLSDADGRLARLSDQVITVAALIAALAVPLGFALVNRLLAPLSRLGDAARAIASGDLSRRVDSRRRDEIGELACAFNSMAVDLARSHDQVMRQQAELEDRVLARTFQLTEVNRRLSEEIAEKEDFLQAVTHDLSAPLRNVTGMVGLLRNGAALRSPEQAGDLLDRIDGNVKRELELIDDLLELSRIRTRREERQVVDMQVELTAVIDNLQFELDAKETRVVVDRPLPVIYAEKLRIRQLLQNLIDNAVKYTNPEARRAAGLPPAEIRVSWVDRASTFEFRVADQGIGISPRDRHRVFYVFRRAKDGFVAKTPGRGVGLATCKSIVQNYLGRIWVEPNSGGGSVFCFTLAKSRVDRPRQGADVDAASHSPAEPELVA